jgi:hypothetical protein
MTPGTVNRRALKIDTPRVFLPLLPTVPFPKPPPALMTPPPALHSLTWPKQASKTTDNMTRSPVN